MLHNILIFGTTHQSRKGKYGKKKNLNGIHTRLAEIFTKILTKSPLYQEIPSYR
jgi:hypothetical protein